MAGAGLMRGYPSLPSTAGQLAATTNAFDLSIESDIRGVAVLLGRTGGFGLGCRRRHSSFRRVMMRASIDGCSCAERYHRDRQKRLAGSHEMRRFSALSLPLFGTTS
jgi:hypothetical protein